MTERTPRESRDFVFGIDEPNSGSEAVYCDGATSSLHFIPADSASPTARRDTFETALSRTIQSEIIPRLLMAHRTAPPAVAPVDPDAAGKDEIATLVEILVRHPLSEARRMVDAMRARGVAAETVVADILPAAARHVGWLWETDACTFVDVTFALSRLQQLLRHYAPSMGAVFPTAGAGRRVLLSVMPGEQHTFGITVVEEVMRRATWDVLPIVPATAQDLCRAASEEWFDIIGLSAAGDAAIDAMTTLIPQLRAASANRSVRIVAGGAAVLRSPEGATGAGVDCVVTDAISGMTQMEEMLRCVNNPC